MLEGPEPADQAEKGKPENTGRPDNGVFQPNVSGRRGPDQRLGRNRRLVSPKSFQEAYEQGRRYIGAFMVLWLREGDGAQLRLGVVSSRKVGNSPERARARRLLREAFRLNRHRFSGPFDVVLVGRRRILNVKWPQIVEELLALAEKAGIFDRNRAEDKG